MNHHKALKTAYGDENEAIGRSLPAVPTRLPAEVELDLENDRLLWRERRRKQDLALGPNVRDPSPTMLNAFLRLADQVPEAIADFATRYGVLDICEHGLPSSHNRTADNRIRGKGLHPFLATMSQEMVDGPSEFHCGGRLLPGRRGNWHWEPLEAWRASARFARAILFIAKDLREGKSATDDAWAQLGAGPSLPMSPVERLGYQRSVLGRTVTHWLALGGVMPVLTWGIQSWRPRSAAQIDDYAAPRIEFEAAGLFGALGLQLAMAIGYGKGIAICSGCGKLYFPKRAPSAGRRNFCPDPKCRMVAAWRQSKRDQRSNQSPESGDEVT